MKTEEQAKVPMRLTRNRLFAIGVLAGIAFLTMMCAFARQLEPLKVASDAQPSVTATGQPAQSAPASAKLEEAAKENTETANGRTDRQAEAQSESEKPHDATDAEPAAAAAAQQAQSVKQPEPSHEPAEPETRPAQTAAKSFDFSGGWGQPERKAPPASKPGHVTNLFFDTPIREALSEIATQTGEIIVPDASIQGLITCDLEEVPLEKALDIVLSTGSFAWRRMDGFILVGSTDSESPSFSTFSQTRRVKMNYIKAEDAVKMLSKPMQKLANANAANNAVSVTAPPALLERIISDLKLIDQPSRHVMLDARVVALEHRDLLNLGLQWDWPKIRVGTFSDSEHHGGGSAERVQWPWGIQIGYTPGQEFTNSLLLTLNLLTQNDEATVISSPQLMAQDGQESQIKVATEEYFKITQESVYYTRFELETIETGTTLTIRPLIGDNNEITLEISTEVSDVIARGEDNLPVVTRRTTKNTVRIEDGGTAAIAGLIDSRTRTQEQHVPGLSWIPIFGQLFRNSAGQQSDRQLAVFVTARLMPEEGLFPQEPAEQTAAIEPVGDEFKAALQEALSTLSKGNKKP